jgi:hypothetical protein
MALTVKKTQAQGMQTVFHMQCTHVNKINVQRNNTKTAKIAVSITATLITFLKDVAALIFLESLYLEP